MQQQINFTTAKDGWKLAWSRIGSGPPVLYLLQHHLARSMEVPSFAAAIGRAAARRSVLRFDQRGMGLSQRGIDAISQSIICGDIEAVLDAAEVERADIVSNINMCLWAVPFAVRHPERVNRLVLGGPMAQWRVVPALRDMLFKLRDSDYNVYWETVLALQLDSSPDEIRAAARICQENVDREDYVTYVNAWYENPITTLLPHCHAPTLVVRHGGRKIYEGVDAAEHVASTLPNVRVLTPDGGGSTLASNRFTSDVERLTSDGVLSFLDEGWTKGSGRADDPGLSEREKEVLALVAAGKRNAQVAEALGIGEATAARHVHNVLTKLGMANRTEAAAWASRNGIGTPRA